MSTFAQFRQFGPYYDGGQLVSAGFVYHYAAGTLSLLDVYTDRLKTTPAAQPLAMDADGVVGCYCDGVYKFVIQDALGDTLYTFDNVAVIDQTTATGKGANLASASTLVLGTDGDEFLVTGTTTINALSGTQTEVVLVFNGALQLTNSGNLILQNGFNYTTATGDVFTFRNEGNGIWREAARVPNVKSSLLVAASTQGAYITYASNVFSLYGAMRGHLHGLTMSTAGSSATMTVAAGIATDSTYVLPISLAASISKTTSAWAVGTGNGGLDTGAIANSTWYHFYLIYRSDTGVTDVLFSLSPTSPTMPTNYAYQRRIGAGLTNGSAQWVAFTQDGDLFLWTTPVADVSAGNPGTSAVTRTLTVPTGLNVIALMNATLAMGASPSGPLLLSELSAADSTPGPGLAQCSGNLGSLIASAQVALRTNTSAQIRSRVAVSDASTVVTIDTRGWMDRRGRDS